MNLNLGSIQIPINAATKTFAVLGKRGAGKSYTGAVMAEEFYKARIPFVVFDPIDVWWGLRLNRNGKDAGLPIVVFGVKHADIPLDREMGRQIAKAVVTENVSCVISTYGMPKVAERHLIAEFSEEIMNINNTPRHIFVEEAHEYVPQRVWGAMGKTFNNVSRLVMMGRNVGLGVTLLNQRAATVNKDVLTQLDTLICMRSVGPQDRRALQDWVEARAAEGDFNKFIQSLPSLPNGEAWIWSPEFLGGVFKRVKIRRRETFHPDREKLGEEWQMPYLDQTDIQSFIEKFKKRKVLDVPPKAVKALRKQYGDFVAPEPTPPPEHPELIKLRNEYESKLLQKDVDIRNLQSVITQIQQIVGNNIGVPLPISVSFSSDAVSLWQSKLGNGLAGRAFKFIAENPNRQFTREQICLAIGVPTKAGHTSNEFGKLMRTGAVKRDGHLYQLNPNI